MIDPRRAGRVLARGVRLLCPRCGRAPLFRGPFTMLARCVACGLGFEREQGYFVGAIYLNYAATAVLALAGYVSLQAVVGLPLMAQVVLWGAFTIVFPLWFFRYSRSLWLSLDYVVDPDGGREGDRPWDG